MPDRLDLDIEQNATLLRASGVRVAKHRGAKATCFCPYHEDKKNPSLAINLQRGTFHCWTCKESGTIAKLVYDQTGHGARYFLGKLPQDLSKQPFSFQDKLDDIHAFMRTGQSLCDTSVDDTLTAFAEAAPPTFGGPLLEWHKSSDASDWLQKRHIPDDVANLWNLRFAFTVDVESQFKYSEYDDTSSFTAHRRLIIPLYGPAGNLLSVEARATQPYEKLKSLFIRPVDFIFNYSILDKTKPLYLAEGFVEAARLRAYRSNVSYMFGTSVSDIKVFLLKRFPEVIVVCDNDEPGYRMAIELQRKGVNIRIKPVPDSFEDLGDANMTNSDIGVWIRSQEAVNMTNGELEAKALFWKRRRGAA